MRKNDGTMQNMEKKENDNLILIGMPGAGKSTVGVVLAKKLGYDFLDSDLLIQKETGKKLSELIREKGLDGFNALEDAINSSIEVKHHVIATGGSAIYGEHAMEHFRSIGRVLYLQLSFGSVQKRLGDLKGRGVSMREDQTLFDLYEERVPLYRKYADVIIDCEHLELREVADRIYRELNYEEGD